MIISLISAGSNLGQHGAEFAARCKALVVLMWRQLAPADLPTRREIQTRRQAREAVLHLDRP